MTVDVNRYQGALKIQSQTGNDILVVDTTGTSYVYPDKTSSKVVITGDLYVLGSRIESTSTIISSTNPILLLNENNEWGGNPSQQFSGLQISRSINNSSTSSAFLLWNNQSVWNGTGAVGARSGVFEFHTGFNTGQRSYGAIRVNKILIDEASASTISGSPRLNILGADNPNAVISVAGHPNYTSLLTHKDDIPNKEYVDNLFSSAGGGASTSSQSLISGKTYITLIDNSVDNATSRLVAIVNGAPVDKAGIINGTVSSGTIVLSVSETEAEFTGIKLVNDRIVSKTSSKLTLDAGLTGTVNLNSSLVFNFGITEPALTQGQVGLFTGTSGEGGTGLYFSNKKSPSTSVRDEFISHTRALFYSMLF